MKQLTAALATLALCGCATLGDIPIERIARVELRQANGTPAGTAMLTAAGDKVTISIAAIGLAEGLHGLHLHMVGTCEGPAFTSAGPHLNPANHQHGTLNPAGSHLGDLPNLTVAKQEAGALSAQIVGTRAAIEASIFDADGTALVVHASADDYVTDPSGNSGTRIACGIFKRS